MKRIIFIAIAIMAIFETSCKKEEMRAPVTQKPTDNPLVLIKKDVEQNGMIGDLYYNKYKPEQKVFEVKMFLKSNHPKPTGTKTKKTEEIITSNGSYFIESIDCTGDPTNCWKDNGKICVLKKSF